MFWAFNPSHAEEQTQFCSSANFFPLYDVHDSFLNCRNAMMDKNPPAHAFSAAQVLRDMEQSSGDFPPSRIEVHGACVHNLKNVDVDIPLNKLVGIAGISGSGKLSRLRRAIHRGIPTLSGGFVDVYQATSHPSESNAGGHIRHVSAALAPPSKTFSARRAIHVRHDDGATQQSAPVVLPLRLACLRTLWRTQPPHNERGGKIHERVRPSW